eukprot:SAG22_NODE_8805_length_628_cov_2.081285_2_plen_60_part_00
MHAATHRPVNAGELPVEAELLVGQHGGGLLDQRAHDLVLLGVEERKVGERDLPACSLFR